MSKIRKLLFFVATFLIIGLGIYYLPHSRNQNKEVKQPSSNTPASPAINQVNLRVDSSLSSGQPSGSVNNSQLLNQPSDQLSPSLQPVSSPIQNTADSSSTCNITDYCPTQN